jgi:GAF domain-containing protein
VWARIAASGEGGAPVSPAVLCRAAVRWLGVDGASVTAVAGSVAREPLSASGEVSARPEELLATTGQAVIASDIRAGGTAQRWPRFSAAALEMGYAGVHAIPMRLRAEVIGTLNLCRTAPNGLDPAVVVAATALADVATIGILQERAVRQQEVAAGQLQVALNSRVLIEQAKGILAERLRVTPDEAFLLLRRYARDHNHPLTELAGDVIRGAAPIVAGK